MNRLHPISQTRTPIRLSLYIALVCFCTLALGAKDAEMAHEVFMRSLKLGGQYTQVSYTDTRYAASASNGSATAQKSTLDLYGPLFGFGFYVVPSTWFHLNFGLDLGALFSQAPLYGISKTTLFVSAFGGLGIRIGDLWPTLGLQYASYSLENAAVSVQGGLEYRLDNWVLGAMYAKSGSASGGAGATAYSDFGTWSGQVYATWLWGKWY